MCCLQHHLLWTGVSFGSNTKFIHPVDVSRRHMRMDEVASLALVLEILYIKMCFRYFKRVYVYLLQEMYKSFLLKATDVKAFF